MNLLSGNELQKIFSTEGGVPQKGGQKDYMPDGSWLDQRKLEAFQEERRDALGQERVRTLGSLMKGIWLPEEGRVQIPKQGKFSKYMGYTEERKQYLLPEETMYLLDEASIEVYYQDVPLSIQEALSTILMPFVSLEQYQVFSYFSRIGYILRRYIKPECKTYEDTINLRKYNKSSKAKKKEKRRKDYETNDNVSQEKKLKLAESSTVEAAVNASGHLSFLSTVRECAKSILSNEMMISSVDNQEPSGLDASTASNFMINTSVKNFISSESANHISSSDTTSSVNDKALNDNESDFENRTTESKFLTSNKSINTCDSLNDVVNKQNNFEELSFKDHSEKSCQHEQMDECSNDQVYSCIPYSEWDYNELNFPDISKSTSFKVTSKLDSLLPPGVEVKQKEYDLCLYRKQYKGRKAVEMEFSFGASGSKAKRSAKNWADYKSQMAAVCDNEVLLTSPVAHLWEGDIKPLVKPQEALSTANILEKLNVIQKYDGTKYPACISTDTVHKMEDFPRIVYDGYEPSSKFKKTEPGKPHFRLVIIRQDEPPPTLAAVYHLYSESVAVDGVPLYWAVVDSGDISFFSINNTELPKHISMG